MGASIRAIGPVRFVQLSGPTVGPDGAGGFIIDNWTEPDILLVHGEVSGQGPLEGVRFGHAWIEIGDEVIDKANGKNIRMPKDVYYAVGNIKDKPGKLFKYTWSEARRKMLEHEHYGPWDLETEL